MARLRSPEKYRAILDAAVAEIAESGLASPTARIAQRAGIASGTLFLYFPTKEDLLNALYLDLKTDVYARINDHFPDKGTLKARTQHIWLCYMEWGLTFPDKRKVSRQLNVSDIVTAETRVQAAEGRSNIDTTMTELAERATLQGLPAGFCAAAMIALQDATMEFLVGPPRDRNALIERAFETYWRAVR